VESYSGTYYQRLDAKGRVALPARLREQLVGDARRPLVVTGWEGAVWLYGPEEWRRLLEKASLMPAQNPSVARFIRYFFGYSAEVEPDGQGRTLIPPALRSYASFEKEVVVAGVIRHIELWDRDRWEERRPTTQEECLEINADLADFNLPL